MAVKFTSSITPFYQHVVNNSLPLMGWCPVPAMWSAVCSLRSMLLRYDSLNRWGNGMKGHAPLKTPRNAARQPFTQRRFVINEQL